MTWNDYSIFLQNFNWNDQIVSAKADKISEQISNFSQIEASIFQKFPCLQLNSFRNKSSIALIEKTFSSFNLNTNKKKHARNNSIRLSAFFMFLISFVLFYCFFMRYYLHVLIWSCSAFVSCIFLTSNFDAIFILICAQCYWAHVPHAHTKKTHMAGIKSITHKRMIIETD